MFDGMWSRAAVLAVMAAMVAALVCAADRQQVAEGEPEGAAVPNFMPEGSTRERRSYRAHVFSWNYEKVEVAAQGWKTRDFRLKMIPILVKLFGTVYNTTTSAPLKARPYLNMVNKYVKRATGENEVFSQCDSEPVNTFGMSECNLNTAVLEIMSLSCSITGAITEAYVRTRLNSTTEKFKLITDGMFQLVTEAVSTELVMLGHFFRMAHQFGSVVVQRYFQSPLPVKGTEKDFVKACDNMYAALADFLLMSSMVSDHTRSGINSEMNSTGLAPEFLKYLEDMVGRGITPEYDNSPFPPLSYYWDMAALEYAVSILSDINVIANHTLSEAVEESGNDAFQDEAFISNVAYAASAGLNDTSDHLKRDGLKAALKSATDGLRMTVYAYSEAGLDIPREAGSVALLDNLESFLKTLKQTFVDVEMVKSISGVASVFGLNNNSIEVSYRELIDFFVPTDYDHLMTMVTQISSTVSKIHKNGFTLNMFRTTKGEDVPDSDLSKLDLLKMAHIVKRNVPNLETSDSAPDISQQTQIKHLKNCYVVNSHLSSETTAPGVSRPTHSTQIKRCSWSDVRPLMNLMLRPGNLEFLLKVADPVVCGSDPKCQESYNKIANEIRAGLGTDAATPLTPSLLLSEV